MRISYYKVEKGEGSRMSKRIVFIKHDDSQWFTLFQGTEVGIARLVKTLKSLHFKEDKK